MGGEQQKGKGLPSAVRGPRPAPAYTDRELAAMHQDGGTLSAKSAEVLLPPTEDPALQPLFHELAGKGLEPGKVYLFAYDKFQMSTEQVRVVLNYLGQQGIRLVVLRTVGDPRAAIRVVDAEELDR